LKTAGHILMQFCMIIYLTWFYNWNRNGLRDLDLVKFEFCCVKLMQVCAFLIIINNNNSLFISTADNLQLLHSKLPCTGECYYKRRKAVASTTTRPWPRRYSADGATWAHIQTL